MAVKPTKPKLAEGVAYTNRNGLVKAAIVVAIPETISPDGLIQPLAEGEVILQVLSARSGRNYVRKASFDAESGTFKGVYPALLSVPDDLSELDDDPEGE